MQIDHNIINSLMAWARLQAPISYLNGKLLERRRVRIEISTEGGIGFNCCTKEPYQTKHFMCRVYLAEPRCEQLRHWKVSKGLSQSCECQPLAETRIA